MTGAITLENYDKRMLFHGTAIKGWGDEWPFLSRSLPPTANETEWHEYFRNHLGGFPPTYRLYRDGKIDHLNMPEEHPQDFDPTYQPLR